MNHNKDFDFITQWSIQKNVFVYATLVNNVLSYYYQMHINSTNSNKVLTRRPKTCTKINKKSTYHQEGRSYCRRMIQLQNWTADLRLYNIELMLCCTSTVMLTSWRQVCLQHCHACLHMPEARPTKLCKLTVPQQPSSSEHGMPIPWTDICGISPACFWHILWLNDMSYGKSVWRSV